MSVCCCLCTLLKAYYMSLHTASDTHTNTLHAVLSLLLPQTMRVRHASNASISLRLLLSPTTSTSSHLHLLQQQHPSRTLLVVPA